MSLSEQRRPQSLGVRIRVAALIELGWMDPDRVFSVHET